MADTRALDLVAASLGLASGRRRVRQDDLLLDAVLISAAHFFKNLVLCGP